MSRRKAMVGICMLCAFAVSAIAAQGASAVTGTTLFTCAKTGKVAVGEKFTKEHCKDADTSPTGEYRHWEIPEKTTTHFTATSAKTNAETNNTTPSKLKATIGGVGVELVTETVHAHGTIENLKAASGEHYFTGSVVITYTGVKEKALGCEVFGGGVKETITTNSLMESTEGKEMFVNFEPEGGKPFAEFELKGCAVAGTYKVVGSLKCVPDGATLTCNHAEVTAQGNLRIGSAAGPKAGYEGTVTVTGGEGKPEDGKPTNPLSVTTVTT